MARSSCGRARRRAAAACCEPAAGRSRRLHLSLLSTTVRLLIERESSPPQVISLGGEGPRCWPEPACGLRGEDDWVARRDDDVGQRSGRSAARGACGWLAHTDRRSRRSRSRRAHAVVIHDGAQLWLVPFTGGPLRALAPYQTASERGVVARRQTLAIGGSRPRSCSSTRRPAR